MKPEDLIPLTKRLNEINETIDKFTDFFETIMQQPHTEITLNVSRTKDQKDEDDMRGIFEVMYGLPSPYTPTGKREVFDINFEDNFAMAVIADIIRTLRKERDYLIEKINQFKEN